MTTATIEAELYGGFADGRAIQVPSDTDVIRVPIPVGPPGTACTMGNALYFRDGSTASGLARYTIEGIPRFTKIQP
jgi:hypothetical protein